MNLNLPNISHRLTSGLATFFTLASFTQAAVVSQVETSASAGQPGAEAFDADLAFQVSNADLIQGIAPVINPGPSFGAAAAITDGAGPSRDFSTSSGVSFLANGQTTLTWTNLSGITVNEVRVFGYGVDDRSLMEYTIEMDSGSGFVLIDSVNDGAGGPVGVSNGTNLVRTFNDSGAALATGVVGIRITYQDNFSGANGAAIGEVDVLGAVITEDGGNAPSNNGTWIDLNGGIWGLSNNWSGDIIANRSGNTARFDTLNLTSDVTVDLNSSRTIGKMTFGDTVASHNWFLKAANPTLSLSLAGGTREIEVVNGTTKIEAAIAGTTGLEKKGAGTLELTRPNTYTGLTKISNGTLTLSPALKVMSFGDSITFGGSGSNGGYRGYLHTLLSPVIPNYQFEGASQSNPSSLPANQRRHNGYSSYPTKILENNLDGLDSRAFTRFGGADRNPLGGFWFPGGNGTGRAAQYPDMALILVGANDIFWGESNFETDISIPLYEANLTSLVNKIQTLRPQCHVVVARISPWNGKATQVADINTKVDSAVAALIAAGKKVSKVDLNTNFPANGLSGDGLHPSDVGYSWMAQRWFEGIKEAMPVMLVENSPLEISAGATLTSENQPLILSTLTGSGEAKINGGKLTVGGNNSTFSFNGIISGNGVVIKTGTGTASLTGASLHTGNTELKTGTLELTKATLADDAALIVSAGSILKLTHLEVDTVGSIILNGATLVDGVYGALDSDAPNRVNFITGTGKLRIGDPNFQTWSDANAGGQAPTQDSDNDGTNNALEHFMGETGNGFTANPVPVNGVITWPRDPNALVTGFRVEHSANLTQWIAVAHSDASMSITPTSISYTLPTNPAPALHFVRLQVTP